MHLFFSLFYSLCMTHQTHSKELQRCLMSHKKSQENENDEIQKFCGRLQALTNSVQLPCRSIYFGCVGSPGGMLTWKRQTSPFLSSSESVPASKCITANIMRPTSAVLPWNNSSVLSNVLHLSHWIFTGHSFKNSVVRGMRWNLVA